MKTIKGLGLTLAVAGLLAGCAETTTTTPTASNALVADTTPKSAVDCRNQLRANSRNSGVSVPVSTQHVGASIAGILIGTVIVASVQSNQLKKCYDAVGAAPEERLPITEAKKEGTQVSSDATQPIGKSYRRGPGGGAGFSSF